METAVKIRGALKSYKGGFGRPTRTAVRGVDLTVRTGSVHGLLGPNGAGKTTTIKMLLGLVRPDGGDFAVMGTDPRVAKNRVGLGFLPEQPYYPPFDLARTTLRRYARLSGVPGDTQVEELLEAVGLGPHADTQLAKYSRGMLQRFGLAQALVGDPAVVVLDEPASGLDPVGQRDVRNLVLELKERGKTVLLSSHQLSEVEVVCDTVTIVSDGLVAAEGPIDELLGVEGRTSVRARGLADGLPDAVVRLADDVAVAADTWVFSVGDDVVRIVVDALDDVGAQLVSISPKRESLEDYFDRMLRDAGEGRAGG